MSRELTEKKRPHTSPAKGGLRAKGHKQPFDDLQAPCRANTQAVLTGVEGKNPIPTDKLLKLFVTNVKNGTHKVDSKAEGDKALVELFGHIDGFSGQAKAKFEQALVDEPPIPNNYEYSFNGGLAYDTVEFCVTKIGRVYGFTRHDTHESCNFTIVKDKNGDGYTYKLQPLDEFNLPPEWAGG